ncbi:hypothetical protein J6590_078122 [Homalodisca vitripennis]|nr:hypothetical protein J6590_078122 [Homalodisca vitripennis]
MCQALTTLLVSATSTVEQRTSANISFRRTKQCLVSVSFAVDGSSYTSILAVLVLLPDPAILLLFVTSREDPVLNEEDIAIMLKSLEEERTLTLTWRRTFRLPTC